MTEDQVIKIIRSNVEHQFPMDCSCCGRHFNSLREYLENTVHIGKPHSYDAELKNWWPTNPLGTFSFSNCKCGTTLVLGSMDMEIIPMCHLLWWAKKETARRKLSINDLLNELRIKIDNQVLNEQGPLQNTSTPKR